MTYQMKKHSVSLVSTILIFGFYSMFVFRAYQEKTMDSAELFVFFATAIVVLIPISIVATIIIHILFNIINRMVANEKEPAFADERDKLIELKAMRNGHVIFIIGFVIAMLSLVAGSTPTMMFVILYVSGFISDAVGKIISIYFYLKGI